MKKNMNLFRLLAVLLAFAMLLTACGKKKSQQQQEPAEEPAEEASSGETSASEDAGKSLMWGAQEETPEEEPAAESEEGDHQGFGRLRCWDNDEMGISLVLNDDGTAVLSDYTRTVDCTYVREGRTLTLISVEDSETGEVGTVQDDGSIQFENADTPFVPVDAPTYTPENAPTVSAEWSIEGTYNYQMEGHWEYYDESGLTLDFDGVDRVSFSLGNRSGTGSYRYDGYHVEIMCDNGEMLIGHTDYEDDLWLDDYEDWFVVDEENYFKENGFFTNWDADWAYTVDTGARYYYEDGSTYVTAPAEWTIIKHSETNTGDGFRELEFTMYCGFLAENNPMLEGEYSYGCQYGLFDAYNGYMLTLDGSYYDDSLGAYVYEYESNGEDVRVECSPESLWEEEVDGYEFRLTIDLSVRIPEHYDGLRIVGLASADTFEEFQQGYFIALQPYADKEGLSESRIYEID